MKGRVGPIAKAIEPLLEATELDRLRSAYGRFVEHGGVANLQRWARAADLTAIRTGFALCGDLATTERMLQLTGAENVPQLMDDLIVFVTGDALRRPSRAHGRSGGWMTERPEPRPPLRLRSSPVHRRGRGVYANRTLTLRAIKVIGYDMDYTLVHYRVDRWEKRAYEHIATRLSAAGFPVEGLTFDPELVARGLVIDTERGNLLKVNRFGFVKTAYGTAPAVSSWTSFATYTPATPSICPTPASGS